MRISSGIPGIFYGPQWIWILSIGMFFSKDPRFIVFLTHFLPYFIIMPIIFYVLSKDLFNKTGSIILWLFFIFSFSGYTTQIWSPNLAPLMFFIILFLFHKTNFILEKKSLFNFFLLGLVQGLLLNLHISFGVGIMVSWFFYFVVIFFFIFVSKKKALMSNLANWFINCFAFGIGFISILLPFFLFELRHGFMQINSLFFTLNQGFIHNKAVVGQIGLTKIQILNTFFNRYTDLLSINNKLSIIIVFLIIGLVLMYIKKGKIKSSESKIIVFLFFNTFVILFTYLTAKNPVWSYHFIAVEIMFIFLTGILIKKYSLVKYILTLWVLILLVINIYRFGLSFNHKQNYPELMEKRATVERIYQDAGGEKFGFFGKNAAIYTFDYDYIFRWMGVKLDSNASIIYLIIPKDLISDKVGFTENRTPEMKYKTMTEWTSQNGTLIIKRRLKK